MQLTSGMDVFAHVCEQKMDTSSNYCGNQYSAIWQETLFALVALSVASRYALPGYGDLRV